MRTIIKLQNHGFKNNPHWYIVVAPKYKNHKGRYIEQVGTWMPRRGKTFDRSIVLNKKRIQYWLGMGAETSQRVKSFLSFVDLLPAPVPKHGSKHQYQKEVEKSQDSFSLNPYQLGPYKQFLNKVLEQEETSYMFRQAILQSNITQHLGQNFNMLQSTDKQDDVDLDSKESIKTEIEKLKQDLNDLNLTAGKLDENRQQLLVSRINSLYRQWKQVNAKEEFKQLHSEQGNFQTSLNTKNLKYNLEDIKFGLTMQEYEKTFKQHKNNLQPINRDQFKAYLLANGDFSEIKAETLAKQAFRTAQYKNQPVLKQDAIDLCDGQKTYLNIAETFIPKNLTPEEKVFVPITKPVTPIPDLNTYDPEDYYEIPKMIDPIALKNKPTDLPNINEIHIPKREPNYNSYPRNTTGRKTTKRKKATMHSNNIYNLFSTYNKPSQCFKGAYMPYTEFKQIEKELFNY